IWMSRRSRLSSAPFALVMSFPSTLTVPEVGRSRAMSSLARVDLPHPDSPTMPSVSPRCRSKETPSTALIAPTWRLKTMPWVSGKCLTRSRTSRIGSPGAAIEDLPPVVAGALAGAAHRLQRGHLGLAPVPAVRAAGVERAAGRHLEQVRRCPLDRVQLPALEVHPRDGLEQPL